MSGISYLKPVKNGKKRETVTDKIGALLVVALYHFDLPKLG